MKSLQSKAATCFGLSIAGFTACIGMSLIAASSTTVSKAETPSKITNAASSPAIEPVPETPKPEAQVSKPKLDPESVKKGKQQYEMFCQACHGPENNNIDSPSNLFDPKWHYGAGREGVEASIKNGIMEKGMPGWGAMIPAEDITALVDYLMSFQKTNTSTDE